MCSSVLCVTLSCTVSPLPQVEYGKIWQVNLVESGFDLGLLNVSFSAKFHGENDQACGRVCHGTFCLEAGPFRCCWRPMSNLQHPFHTERLKEGHISNCTIYSGICDEDFPRSNRWSNTQKSGHKLLRKLPTPEIWAGFHWTWRIQTKKTHVPTLAYACWVWQTAATMAITKKGFEAVLLSLSLTNILILSQKCTPLYLILSLYTFGKQEQWFNRLQQHLVVVLPMRLICIAGMISRADLCTLSAVKRSHILPKKLFMTSSFSKFNSLSAITCTTGPHWWSSAKNGSFEGIPRHSKVVGVKARRNEQHGIKESPWITAENPKTSKTSQRHMFRFQ